MNQRKNFRIVLIKPSHYDDDGYVIQWHRSPIPSNSLAQLYGLVRDCAERRVLGDDVDFVIDAYDETNTIISTKLLIREIKAADAGFVGLAGVQSNQFPRAVDIARPLLDAGLTVVCGGFHVSGCLSMLPELPSDIKEAQRMGMILFAGEAEGRLDTLLRDIWEKNVEPLYNYMNDLPTIESMPVPYLPTEVVNKTSARYTSFDSGRGCPFQCSFCTIINVQGRKSRYRTPDDIEKIVRENVDKGINRFFMTDDNFARNEHWEAILDRLISLRENDGYRFRFIIQVDTLCHRTPNFIEKAARAGCNRAFIGLESISPTSLSGAKKRQNKIWEYRAMLQAWKDVSVITYVGYIIGFPGDTPETVQRDIEIVKRELPVDILEFFILTPLPGSEDHQRLHRAGTWMDPNMNIYDLHHVTTGHPNMSGEELYQAYRSVWRQYYTPDHIETVMRRGRARGVNPKKLMLPLAAFIASIEILGVHPLEAGIFRRRDRTQRRNGMPLENFGIFYAKRVWEIISTHARILNVYLTCLRILRRVEKDPLGEEYTDLAISPLPEGSEHTLELLTSHSDEIPNTHGAPIIATPYSERPVAAAK